MNSNKRPTILIVDDERLQRDGLQRALEDRYDVLAADDVSKATGILETQPVDVLLTDLRMPGDDGLKLLRRAGSLSNPPVSIMMTAYGSIENAVEAMKAGAYHYVTKPVNLDELDLVIGRALKSRQIEARQPSRTTGPEIRPRKSDWPVAGDVADVRHYPAGCADAGIGVDYRRDGHR